MNQPPDTRPDAQPEDSLPADKLEAGLRAALLGDSAPGQGALAAMERLAGGSSRIVLLDEDPKETPDPVIAPVSPADRRLERGKGQYRVDGELARGGMGVVLKGHDTDLGRDVALKILHPEFCSRSEAVQRFVEEAQIGGQLQHPGIVPVYELGLMADERPYIAMKLIKGRTLGSLLADGEAGSNLRPLLLVFEQVCQTVAYAHARGVIHRDLKPSNVMVGAFGEVLVVDWGLAKVLPRGGVVDEKRPPKNSEVSVIETVRSEYGSSHSLAGSVMGTPSYMAPEQARGEVAEVNERADVFSLGAILCEILSGEPPYVGDRDQVLNQAATADLEGAKERLGACGADDELVTLALRCLAPAQSARLRNAGALAKAVQAYMSSVDERAREARLEAERARARAAAERKARKLTAALAGTVLAAVLGGGGGYLYFEGQRRERRTHVAGLVNEAITEAASLRVPGSYEASLAAARRAEALAQPGEVEQGLRARVESLVAGVEEEARLEAEQRTRDQRNAVFLARLDQVRALERYEPFSLGDDVDLHMEPESFESFWQRRDRGYQAVFDEFDLRVESGAAEDVAQSILDTGVGTEIAVRLDDWAHVVLRREGKGSPRIQHLRSVAHLSDPDPWRDSIREAIAADDLEELRELVSDADVAVAEPTTLALLSTGLADLEAPDEAIDFLRAAQSEYPGDWTLNYHLGWRLAERSQHEHAARYLQAAVAAKPDSAAALKFLSSSLRQLGEADAAIHAARRVIELEPDSASAFHRLAVAYQEKSDWEGMWEASGRACELAPDDTHQSLHLLVALEATGQAEEGLALALRLEGMDEAPDFHRALAHSYLQLGDPKAALDHARSALRLDPENGHFHMLVGKCLSESGKYEEAIPALEEALATGFGQRGCSEDCMADCRYLMGVACQATGDLKRAGQLFFQLTETRPDSALGWSGISGMLFDWKDDNEALHEALRHLKRGVALRPEDALIAGILGSVYLYLEQPELAIEPLQNAVALSTNPAYRGNLSLAYCDLGRFGESLAVAEEAIALDQEYLTGHIRKATALGGLQDYDAMFVVVAKVLELAQAAHQDQRDAALSSVSQLINGLTDLDTARDAWRNAIGGLPADAGLLCMFGLVSFDLGDLEGAARSLLQSYYLDPTNEIVVGHIHHLARASLEDDDLQIELMHAVLEVHPDDPTMLNNLAWALVLDPQAEHFDPEKAVDLTSRAVEDAPEDAGLWNTLGLARIRAQRWDAAIQAVEKSISLSPGEGDAYDWCFLAMARHGKGDAAGARECYERARSLDPGDDEELAQIDREVRALLGIDK